MDERTDERELSVTVCTNLKDWRLIWLRTWDGGWDLTILFLYFRSEAPSA